MEGTDGLLDDSPDVSDLLALDPELEELVARAAADGMVIFGRMCPTCGREFVPRRSHGVYCKTSCRVLAWRRRRT